ncbi:hypothetical protein AQ1_01278 [alpha proteobacterium Q-1]|nr:hypothetical protein AQ1_01278 [alpha proteobacterium Q-1]
MHQMRAMIAKVSAKGLRGLSLHLVAAVIMVLGLVPVKSQATEIVAGGLGDGSCGNATVTAHEASGAVVNFKSCVGRLAGNDATGDGDPLLSLLNDEDIFGATDWIFFGKSDGNNPAFLASTDQTSGIWSLWDDTAAIAGPFVISFKHGNGFSAFFFDDLISVRGGDFALSSALSGGGRNNRVNALSHASVFLSPTTSTTVAVPLPATLVFLGFGLILLGLLGGRRSRLCQLIKKGAA